MTTYNIPKIQNKRKHKIREKQKSTPRRKHNRAKNKKRKVWQVESMYLLTVINLLIALENQLLLLSNWNKQKEGICRSPRLLYWLTSRSLIKESHKKYPKPSNRCTFVSHETHGSAPSYLPGCTRYVSAVGHIQLSLKILSHLTLNRLTLATPSPMASHFPSSATLIHPLSLSPFLTPWCDLPCNLEQRLMFFLPNCIY